MKSFFHFHEKSLKCFQSPIKVDNVISLIKQVSLSISASSVNFIKSILSCFFKVQVLLLQRIARNVFLIVVGIGISWHLNTISKDFMATLPHASRQQIVLLVLMINSQKAEAIYHFDTFTINSCCTCCHQFGFLCS